MIFKTFQSFGMLHLPSRVLEQEQSDPQNLSAMAAKLCIVFGKSFTAWVFFVGEDFISVGGGLEVPHRAGAGPGRRWALGHGQGSPLACVGPLGRPFGSGLHLTDKKSP